MFRYANNTNIEVKIVHQKFELFEELPGSPFGSVRKFVKTSGEFIGKIVLVEN